MELQIPNLAEKKLIYLSTCGRIEPASKELKEWVAKHEEHWLIYRLDDIACRLGVDNYKSYVHLHLDISTKEFFEGRKLPQPSKNAPDLGEVLTTFAGQQVRVTVAGDLFFLLVDSPGFWKGFYNLNFRKGNWAMKMRRIAFDIEGDPIEAVSLEIDEKHANCTITTRGTKEIEFSEKYLLVCSDFITSASARFIKQE